MGNSQIGGQERDTGEDSHMTRSERTLGDYRRMAESFKRSPERDVAGDKKPLSSSKTPGGALKDVSDFARINKKRYKYYKMKQEVSSAITFLAQALECEAHYQVNDLFCTEMNLSLDQTELRGRTEGFPVLWRKFQETQLSFMKIPRGSGHRAEDRFFPKHNIAAKDQGPGHLEKKEKENVPILNSASAVESENEKRKNELETINSGSALQRETLASQFRASRIPVRPSSTFKDLFSNEILPLKPPQLKYIFSPNPNDISLEKLHERRSQIKQQRSSDDKIERSISENSKILNEIQQQNIEAKTKLSPEKREEAASGDLNSKSKDEQPKPGKKQRRSRSAKGYRTPKEKEGNFTVQKEKVVPWNASTHVSNSKKKEKEAHRAGYKKEIPTIKYDLSSKWPKAINEKKDKSEKAKIPGNSQQSDAGKNERKGLNTVSSTPVLIQSPGRNNQAADSRRPKQNQGRGRTPLLTPEHATPNNEAPQSGSRREKIKKSVKKGEMQGKAEMQDKAQNPKTRKALQKDYQTEPKSRGKWKLDQIVQTSEERRHSNKSIQTSLALLSYATEVKSREDTEEKFKYDVLTSAKKNAEQSNHRRHEEKESEERRSVSHSSQEEEAEESEEEDEGPVYVELKLADIVEKKSSSRGRKQGQGRKNKELLKFFTLEELLKKAAYSEERPVHSGEKPKYIYSGEKSKTLQSEERSKAVPTEQRSKAYEREEGSSAKVLNMTDKSKAKGKEETGRQAGTPRMLEERTIEDFFPPEDKAEKKVQPQEKRTGIATIRSEKVPLPSEVDQMPGEEVIQLSLRTVPLPNFSSAEKAKASSKISEADPLHAPRREFHERISSSRRDFEKERGDLGALKKERTSVSPVMRPEVGATREGLGLGQFKKKEDAVKRSRYDLKTEANEDFEEERKTRGMDSARRETGSLEKIKRLFDSVAERNPLESRLSNMNSSKREEEEEDLKLFYKYQKMYVPSSNYEKDESKMQESDFDSPKNKTYTNSVSPFFLNIETYLHCLMNTRENIPRLPTIRKLTLNSKKQSFTRSQSPKNNANKLNSSSFERDDHRTTTKTFQLLSPQLTSNIEESPTSIKALLNKKKLTFKSDKDSDFKIDTGLRMALVPKTLGMKKTFTRSQSPKLKKVDALLIESPFWKNDFEYNFQAVDHTYFEHYYANESLVRDNEKAKKFNEVEFEKYDVKMKYLIEQIKDAKDGLVLKGTRLEDEFLEYFNRNSKIQINTPKIILNQNQLTGRGASLLLKKINEVVLYMDLSYNCIFPLCFDPLTRMLTNPQTKLQYLSLTNCKIRDEGAKKLFFSIMLNKSLRVLKLSNNQITDECASHFRVILQNNCPLTEFYLSWNQVTAFSGIQIAESLHSNQNLRVLDLSFNKLGAKLGEKSCAESLKELLMSEDSELLHLDISHTNFSLNEAKIIAEGLENNHKIYGFHFQGNPGKLDSLGFLVFPDEEEGKLMLHAAIYKPIEGVAVTQTNFHRPVGLFKRRKPDSLDKFIRETSNCWICEGWKEQTFEYNPSNRPREKLDPNLMCYVHLDFYEWQPLLMNQMDGKYTIKRMTPPGEIFFFFTYGGRQIVSRKDPISKNEDFNIKININGEIKQFYLPNLNKLTFEKNQNLILDDYTVNASQAPRTRLSETGNLFNSKNERSLKFTWIKETSIFTAFEEDNEDLLNKSLDADWKSCKILSEAEVSAETSKALHDIIFSVYVYIKDCHKYFSALDHEKQRFFVMPKASFFKMIEELKGSMKLKLTNDELSALFDSSQNFPNRSWPSGALCRAEFVELLIRIANQVYFQEHLISDRFSAFLREGFFVFLKEFHQQSWREENVWIASTEFTVNFYMQVFKSIFQKYARTAYYKKKYGEYITFSEFYQIWLDSKLVEEKEFPEQGELERYFYLSAATQVLDILSMRHSIINFIEFLEAVIRVSYFYKLKRPASHSNSQIKATMSPLLGTPKVLPIKRFSGVEQTPRSVSTEKAEALPAHVKLEKIVWKISELIEDHNIKVNRESIFENISMGPSLINTPRSPRKTVIIPQMKSINFMRSRSHEEENNIVSRPLLRLKSKFNQILKLAKLPID